MKKLLLLSALAIISFACTQEINKPPVNLKIEYGATVTDVSNPRFSWHLSDTMRGAQQTAYQILVSSEPSLLTEKKADFWNSGKVASDQSVFIDYAGKAPEQGKRHYWTVRVWDQNGEPSSWCSPVYFDMGITTADGWSAKWIGADASAATSDSTVPSSILLRNEFNLAKQIRNAKLYVTGLGNYQFFLNGKKVGMDLLTPGWTDYPTRIQYQVYDVKDQLKKGTNAAGFILGNMWYSSGLGWNGAAVYSKGPMKAFMQLEVEYVNGATETFITDENWKWHFSPIVENTIYHGEKYDARLEIDQWNQVGLDETDWQPADLYESDPNTVLSAQFSPTIRVTREIKPVKISQIENGSWVFDMGVNMTGGIRLKTEGAAGTEVVMKFAELLHPDGSVAQENLRSARVIDKYTMKGGGPETWEPTFTYHGFRYVEISGLPAAPDSTTVIALNFHNAADETGSFSCSNELLNQIQSNILNGQRSNMFSVPTDCPQRDERLGWMGDAQVFAATSCYNMDMAGFYAKWVRDIADSQSEEGWVTDVNPAIVVTGPAKPAWGDAFLVVPWEMYRFYGDKRILETYLDKYAAWVEYMKSLSKDNLYIYDSNGWGGYGDWISVVKSPAAPISVAYYYLSTKLVSDFAAILDQPATKAQYNELALLIKDAFHRKYFDQKTINYEGATQTAMLLPLNFGLTPEEYKNQVAENLANDVVARGYHPSTGFLGTKYVLPTLSDYGYHEIAYKTATSKEYPSWGYMAENGATSMWELWNSDTERPEGMNSRNHFALGSVGEWYYTHLAGIRIDDNQPGFKHTIIEPRPAEGLDWARASIGTPYGKLMSSWKNENGRFTLEVLIPANTTATVKIPVLSDVRMEVYESKIAIVNKEATANAPDGVTFESLNDNSIVLKVTAGRYTFEYLY